MLTKAVQADASTEVDEAAHRRRLAEGYVMLAERNAFQPQSFWTPTFDEARVGRVSADRAISGWKFFVRVLNTRMYGKNFRRKCKHSMFSYIAAVDYSDLGAVHLHVVVDGWVDYEIAHAIWKASFGGLNIQPINSEEELRVANEHVVKYALKASDLVTFWFRDRPAGRVRPYTASGQGVSRGVGPPSASREIL